jgi:hypothetical protein
MLLLHRLSALVRSNRELRVAQEGSWTLCFHQHEVNVHIGTLPTARMEDASNCVPIRPCPACARPIPRHLDHISMCAVVTHFRCDGCGYAWATTKEGANVVNPATRFGMRTPAET